MATVVNTTKIAANIEDIIGKANEFIIVISPYLNVHDRLKQQYKNNSKRIAHNYLIYREEKNKNEGFTPLNWFNEVKNIKIFKHPNLHAKCYINESKALLTSANLYDYSLINNIELGVLFDSIEDKELYMNLLNEVQLIFQSCNSSIEHLIDYKESFSMRRLYESLSKKYSFPKSTNENGAGYKYICKIVMEHYHFAEDELYEDKSAIKREVKFSKEQYYNLFRILAETGTPK